MRACIEFHAELEPVFPNRWLARWGDAFQAPSGATPAEAMDNFDIAWGEAQIQKVPDHSKWLELGLTGKQAHLLDLIVKAGPSGLHRERAMAGLYSASEKDWPQARTLDVFICKIRKTLKAANYPMTIDPISGFGWRAVETAQEITLPTEFMAILRKQRHPRTHTQ